MSDLKLRELERGWSSLGDQESAQRLVQERARQGVLGQERLELAAYAGHSAARNLCLVEAPTQLDEWLQGLARWGEAARIRAAFSAAWCAAPQWYGAPGAKSASAALEALATLIVSGDHALSKSEHRALERLTRGKTPAREALMDAVLFAASPESDYTLSATARSAARVTSFAYVFNQVRQDLADWALGLGDPVTTRRDPLEELAQRLADCGDGDQDASLLLLRFRFDDLNHRQLELASLLGDPGARAAWSMVERASDADPSWPDLLEQFASVGRRALVFLAVGAAEDAAESWQSRHPDETSYTAALQALREWLSEDSRERLRRVESTGKVAYRHHEPPWAAYRAGLAAQSRRLEDAQRSALGALRWALAQRLVSSADLRADYRCMREIQTDQLEQLDPATRAALGLEGCDTLFQHPQAAAFRSALRLRLVPRLLETTNPALRERLAAPIRPPSPGKAPRKKRKPRPPPPSPNSPASPSPWERYRQLSSEEAVVELLRRARARELPRKRLRLAVHLGHAAARETLLQLKARVDPEPELVGALAWCEGLWLHGQEAWARAVLGAMRCESSRVVVPMRTAIEVWLSSPADMALQDLHELARREGRRVYRGSDREPSHSDTARAEWSTALLSIRPRRTKTFDEAARSVGALARRERVSAELLPWALQLTESTTGSPPSDQSLTPYAAGNRFEAGEWIEHPVFGVGRVVKSDPRQAQVSFQEHGLKALVHQR